MGQGNEHGYTKVRMQAEAVADAVPIKTLVFPDGAVVLEGADEAHVETGSWIERKSTEFANLGSAVSEIGTSTPTAIVLNNTMEVNIPVAVPPNIVFRGSGERLQKSGTGAIDFEGFGLLNPTSIIPIFEGFATGDIEFSGDDYPRQISTELWDTANDSLQDRFNRADLAVAGKSAHIFAYPRTLTTASAIVGEFHHLIITGGDYDNTVATFGGSNWAPFLMKNNSSLTGMPGNRIYESAVNGNGWLIYGWHTRSGGGETTGYQENIHVRGINYVSSSLTMTDTTGGSSAIQLGNVINGSVKECSFYKTKNYAVLVGLYGTDGNHARNFFVEDNVFIGVGTQVLAVINGIGVRLKGNYFDQHDTPGTSSYAVIDIEPNAADDRVEDLEIDDNTIDARDIADGSKYVYCGIAIQAALEGSIKNVRVTRNRIYGADISAAGTTLPLANGIICWGVWGGDFFDNTVQSAFQRAYIFTQNRGIRFQLANLIQCTDVVGDNYAMLVEACSDSDFKHLTFRESINSNRQSTGIYESEVWHPITSTGSAVTADHTVGLFKFFYDFYDGQSVRVNGADLTVSNFDGINQLTLSAAVGTLIKYQFDSGDIDTTANTIAYTAHPYNTGAQVWLWNDTNTLPAPLANSTTLQAYFAIDAGANILKIAMSYEDALAGIAVDLTSGGTGNHYLSAVMATQFSNNKYEDCDCPDGISAQPGSIVVPNILDYDPLADRSLELDALAPVSQPSLLGSNAPAPIDPVSWINVVGATISGIYNTQTKTAADGWGNAGAFSAESIPDDGFMETTITEVNKEKMFGLSYVDAGQNYTGIDYAFDINNAGTISIYELGVGKGTFGGTAVANTTVFKIERVGTLVSYYVNGAWVYDSLTASSGVLHVDTAISHLGGTIGRVVIEGTFGNVQALSVPDVQLMLAPASINNQTGTTYTLAAGDNGKVVALNNAAAITLTVPSGLGVGFNVLVVQKGAGQITFTASGTTIRQRQSFTKSAGQYAACSLVAHVADDFILGGDLSA